MSSRTVPPHAASTRAASARTTVRVMGRRALVTLTATSAALTAFTLPATAATPGGPAPAHATQGGNGNQAITLDGSRAFPESVAADRHFVYAGSIGDGTVYRGRTGATTLEPFLPAGQDGRTQA